MGHQDDLFPGFRRDGSALRTVPAKRTSEGKAWAERFSKVARPDRDMPGFPERIYTEGFALYPSVEKVGGDYFLKMRMIPALSEMEKIDTTIWAPAKLSDYHLVKESYLETQTAGESK